MTRTTSIRLNEDTISQLDQLAASVDRPRAWLIEQAITQYLREQRWQVQAIGEALADYRAGTAELVPHEQVMARIEQKIRDRL